MRYATRMLPECCPGSPWIPMDPHGSPWIPIPTPLMSSKDLFCFDAPQLTQGMTVTCAEWNSNNKDGAVTGWDTRKTDLKRTPEVEGKLDGKTMKNVIFGFGSLGIEFNVV